MYLHSLHYEKFADGSVKCIEDEIPFELPDGWAWTRLASVLSLSSGKAIKVRQLTDVGEYPVYGGNGINGTYFDYNVEANTIIIGRVGYYCGSVYKTISKAWVTDNALIATVKEPAFFELEFLVEVLKYLNLGKTSVSTAQPVVSGKGILPLIVPVPPKKEQINILKSYNQIVPIINILENDKEKILSLITTIKSKILDLAIRGQLVSQNPDDEPASVLLERIRAEKEELIKQGKIKRDKKESIIFKSEDNSYYLNNGQMTVDISDDLPFDIPDSWYWTRLKDIFIINPRNKLADDLDVSFIPMPLIDDGYSGKHTTEVRQWKEVKTGFTHFAEGDIGIAKITPCFENRKSTIFENLSNGYGAGTTELHILRPFANSILAQYLLAYVKSDYFVENGKQTFTGAVGQQRIDKEYVEHAYFPIPPLSEQERIVQMINNIFEHLNVISEAIF